MSEKRIGVFSQFFPPKPTWTAADVPDQAGKVVIITGASGGIGQETARVSVPLFLNPHRDHPLLIMMMLSQGAALEGRQSIYCGSFTRKVSECDR
jgi:hypothetical protein